MASRSAHAGGPRRRFAVREARASDVGPLVALYRSQPPEQRRLHHPYPFDRPRATLVFAGMVLGRRLRRWLIRRAPGWGFLVLVAVGGDTGELLGYGTARFLRDREGPYARFGFLVHPRERGAGIGTALALALYRTSLSLGVERGGGLIAPENAVSRHLIEGLGFHLELVNAPGGSEGPSMAGIADLRKVLERAEATEARRSDPAP